MVSVNELLTIMRMASKRGVMVNPHTGGVGFCGLVVHPSAIDF